MNKKRAEYLMSIPVGNVNRRNILGLDNPFIGCCLGCWLDGRATWEQAMTACVLYLSVELETKIDELTELKMKTMPNAKIEVKG
jgi:hypothetical protein